MVPTFNQEALKQCTATYTMFEAYLDLRRKQNEEGGGKTPQAGQYCFSIIGEKETLMLQATSQTDFNEWVMALRCCNIAGIKKDQHTPL